MSEEKDLLAKIGQLAGQINKHKTQSEKTSYGKDSQAGQYVSRPASSRPHPTWSPYQAKQQPRRPAAPHRNRTLVLNNASPAAGTTPTPTSSSAPSSDNDIEMRSGTPSGWVAKRDRHMQLINSAIYDKEAQARTRALEETWKNKAQKRAQVEGAKVLRYAQGAAGKQFPNTTTPVNVQGATATTTTTNTTTTQPSTSTSAGYQVFVNDIPYRVARGGGKLIKLSNDPKTANNTPKRVTIAGVAFVRSKNGNLHRLGAVTSKRKPTTVKKRNELCKRFSTTGTCYKGPSCLYIHDPNKVAICKEYLQTGKCSAGISCDLSHEPSPHRSPACMHFLRGRCSNPECRYAHVRVTPGAPVCREFATLGYCEKGAACEERHVHECPDYANTGVCHRKRCHLPHVDRAGQIRKMAANRAGSPPPPEEDDEDDLSSEEEEYDEIDSEDVDSDDDGDETTEVIMGGADSGELAQQQDFVGF